jgi:glycosyltransferase involved in cell wall biosynthesis
MKKKIIFLVNNLSFFLSHRLEIALAAKDEGYDVKVVYGDQGNLNTKILTKKGITCFHVPLQRGGINLFMELRSIFSIWTIFYQFKPDIVHLITIKAYLYGGIAARITKVPCVVSAVAGLGILFNKKKLRNFFYQKLLYLIFKLSFSHSNQKVIFQNLDDRKKLSNWIGLDPKKTILFKGSGVNLSKFRKLSESKNNIIIVCFASRLLIEKGIWDYISAAKIIKKRGIKARFLLAGTIDPGNPTSITEIDLNNIIREKVVEVLGYQKDIPRLYEKSNIICLPSFYGEGLPKSLIEAAAASRAIVTTNHPGCRDAIIPYKTGLLVPVKNPQKLANALQWLIEHPKERIAMGKAARKFAKKNFQIKKIVQNHLDVYKELLSNRIYF